MKDSKFLLYFLGAVLVFLLSGCLYENDLEYATSTASQTTTSTAEIGTGFPPPVSAFTPVPTLSSEDANKYLLYLIRTNGNCQLPCWWGITPGKTTFPEARTILAPLSNLSAPAMLDRTDVGQISPVYILDGESVITIGVGYIALAEHEEIGLIEILTGESQRIDENEFESIYGDVIYNTLLEPYTVQGVLSNLGLPTEIIFSMDISPGNLPGGSRFQQYFYIYVLYPERGTFLRYTTEPEIEGDIIRGCPSKMKIDLWLISETNADAYQDILMENAPVWANILPFRDLHPPIESAIGMTIEEFYEIFKEPTDQCLETPLSAWPHE